MRRQRNDLDGAFEAIRQALTLDGRNFGALMMSATMLEREGHAVPAALAYGAALANAPPDEALDAATLQAIRRGREVHGAYTQASSANTFAARSRTPRATAPRRNAAGSTRSSR